MDTALPGDIRLMNATANVLMALGLAAVIAMALVWLARQPVFALKGVLIEGDELAGWVATARELDCTLMVDEFYSHYIYRAAPGRLPANSPASPAPGAFCGAAPRRPRLPGVSPRRPAWD